MTPLRQRMLDELQLRNYSAKTVNLYVGQVARFALPCGQKTRPHWKFFGSLICSGVGHPKTQPISWGFGERTAPDRRI